MFDYVPVTEVETDPGSPSRSSLWKRWWKNPIAMFEGAAGAPRIRGEAVALWPQLPVLTVAASDAYDLTEGLPATVGTPDTTVTGGYVLAHSWYVGCYTGAIRFRATHASVAVGGGVGVGSNLILQKNSVTVASFTATSEAFRLVDVLVVPGETVQWWHKTPMSSDTSKVYFPAARASNAYVAQPLWRRAL